MFGALLQLNGEHLRVVDFRAIGAAAGRMQRRGLVWLVGIMNLVGAVSWGTASGEATGTAAGGYCSARVLPLLEGPPPSWTLGKKRLLFYRVQLADDVEEPVGVHEVDRSLEVVNEAFRRMSFDQYSLEWAVTPALKVGKDKNHYMVNGDLALLWDARAAAAEAGLDYEKFDLDMVWHSGVPGWGGGRGLIGQRGAWVGVIDPGVLVHELGHNLGLQHANFMDTIRPRSDVAISPPFPSNVTAELAKLPIAAESLIGRQDVRSPGRSVEYGDAFDPMGLSLLDMDFQAGYKAQLRWLNDAQIKTVHSNGVYRVYAFDTGMVEPGRAYALRISKPVIARNHPSTVFQYWIQCRRNVGRYGELDHGVELHWMEPSGMGYSHLVDSTPGTGRGPLDAPLALGRTLEDLPAQIRITPIARGDNGTERWFDVAVRIGTFPENRPPRLEVKAEWLRTRPGEAVRLEARASDPDGDPLAYFWDFSDGTRSENTAEIVKSWSEAGDYVVRCEASDLRGGITSRHLVIRVGDPEKWGISGRVLDEMGQPLRGVRVHNGRVVQHLGDDPTFAMTETDSDGFYRLSGLGNGSYEVDGFLYGYRMRRKAGEGAVVIEEANIEAIDFVAQAWPEVQVEVNKAVFTEGEPGIEFTFTRSGPVESSLHVPFVLNGETNPDDHELSETYAVVIPAGARSVTRAFVSRRDYELEHPEQLTLTVHPPTEFVRPAGLGSAEEGLDGIGLSMRGSDGGKDGVPAPVVFAYPGWELRTRGQRKVWFQTDPLWAIGERQSVTVTILDSTPEDLPRVWVESDLAPARENPITPAFFLVSRSGREADGVEVYYTVGGTALAGSDYEVVSGSVIIPAGHTSARIWIQPIADGLWEGEEHVIIELTLREEYAVMKKSAMVRIQDALEQPQRLEFVPILDGTIMLGLFGEPGREYVIETSPNLREWSAYSTNRLESNPLLIRIPPFEESGARFYRSYRVTKE